MKVLVCGDRNWNNKTRLWEMLDAYSKDIDLIIEGDACGADRMSREWGNDRGLMVMTFPADWNTYGKSAGPIRNRQMLKEGYPHIVFAFHNNIKSSKGTKDMIGIALKQSIPVLLVSDTLITRFDTYSEFKCYLESRVLLY